MAVLPYIYKIYLLKHDYWWVQVGRVPNKADTGVRIPNACVVQHVHMLVTFQSACSKYSHM